MPISTTDLINDVIGSSYYEENYSPRALRDALLGVGNTNLVKVSRHYFGTKPPVVIDFENPKSQVPFMPEEKRRWFAGKGTVYIGIPTNDRITLGQLKARLQDAKAALEQSASSDREQAALQTAAAVDPPSVAPVVSAELDRLALEQLRAEIGANPNLRGAAKAARLRVIRKLMARASTVSAVGVPPSVAGARCSATTFTPAVIPSRQKSPTREISSDEGPRST